MDILLFALIGMVSGLIAGLVGLAGGIVVVPALICFYGVDMLHDAIVVSWFVVFFNSISAVTKQLKVRTPEQRRQVYGHARSFLVGIVLITPLMAVGLASSTDLISVRAVAMLQLCLAAAMLIPVQQTAGSKAASRSRHLVDAMVGGVVGGVSTLIGVGGGTYTVGYFVLARKRQFQDAIATANMAGLAIGTLSIMGFLASNFVVGQAVAATGGSPHHAMPLFGAIVLLASGVAAAPVGVALSRRMPTQTLKRILIGAIIISSVKLLLTP